MKVADAGFERCCNAPALVDAESILIPTQRLTQVVNDKQPVELFLDKVAPLPEGLSRLARKRC